MPETKDMRVLLYSYADLSGEDLSVCINRACDKFGGEKAFLCCITLAKLAYDRGNQLHPSDVASAENHQRSSKHLQLGAAAILKENYRDTFAAGWEKERKESKENNLQFFLMNEACQNALYIAQEMSAELFFSQPETRAFINRLWYGEDLENLFEGLQDISRMPYINKLEKIMALLKANCFLIFQTLLLPLTMLPIFTRMFPLLTGITQVSQSIKYPFSLPFVRFLYNCLWDIFLAVLFTILNYHEISSLQLSWKMSLAFAVSGTLSFEFRYVITKKSIQSYFRDPFNLFDMPALLLVTFALLCSIVTPSNDILMKTMLSLASIFLWLRVLRILTLIPSVGPMVLMLFRMMNDVVQWMIILLIFVLGFYSGVRKFEENLGNLHENCQKHTLDYFFEDAILGRDNLFNCMKDKSLGFTNWFGIFFSTGIVYSYFLFGNVLLVNMLIAMMGESFTSLRAFQAENYLLQRASHCLDMYNEKDLPFSVFYLPFAFYELFYQVYYKPEYGDTLDDNEYGLSDEETPSTYSYESFYEYITKYQDKVLGEVVVLKKALLKAEREMSDSKRETSEKIDKLSSMMSDSNREIYKVSCLVNELLENMKRENTMKKLEKRNLVRSQSTY